MHEILIDFALMYKGYHEISNYAGYKKVNIINCTNGSSIDSFNRYEQY